MSNRTTTGMERKGVRVDTPFNARCPGPQPTLYGKVARHEKPTHAKPERPNDAGPGWWVGLSREQFDAELKSRDKDSWGAFGGVQNVAYAPDVFPAPRRKRVTEI